MISSNILEPKGTSFTLIAAEMIENHGFWADFNTLHWRSLKSRQMCFSTFIENITKKGVVIKIIYLSLG